MSANVMSIITAWLRDHGYDGLCNEDCGCGLEGLAPCLCHEVGIPPTCKPAYRWERERCWGADCLLPGAFGPDDCQGCWREERQG